MTIFMGVVKKEFAFGVIDSRLTKPSSYEDYDCKIFKLDNYNLSFASLGIVLDLIEVDQGLKANIDNLGSTLSYQEVIDTISQAYRNAYAKQTSNEQSIVVMFGYDPTVNDAFMYECESPNFKPVKIKENHVVFRGAYEDEYRKKGQEIYNKHFLNKRKINLLNWATMIFDSLSAHNEYVGYPYAAHLHEQVMSLEAPYLQCRYAGGVITENGRKDPDEKFTVLK